MSFRCSICQSIDVLDPKDCEWCKINAKFSALKKENEKLIKLGSRLAEYTRSYVMQTYDSKGQINKLLNEWEITVIKQEGIEK